MRRRRRFPLFQTRSKREMLLSLLSVLPAIAAVIALPWIGNLVVALSGVMWWVATLTVICVLVIVLPLAGRGIMRLWEDSQEHRQKLTEWVDEPVERASLAVSMVAILLVISGVVVAVLGFRYLYQHGTLKDLTTDFYANLAVDLISVGVTVLIIDRLYERRSKQEEKQRIIRQLRSPSTEFAKEAIRIVNEKDWHRDGSLKGANLMGAHLEGANLAFAHLEGADLESAHLEGASLMDIHLMGANLMWAHLESATLWGAHLEGVDLFLTYLEGADLGPPIFDDSGGAIYDQHTTWPEGFDPVKAGAVYRESKV